MIKFGLTWSLNMTSSNSSLTTEKSLHVGTTQINNLRWESTTKTTSTKKPNPKTMINTMWMLIKRHNLLKNEVVPIFSQRHRFKATTIRMNSQKCNLLCTPTNHLLRKRVSCRAYESSKTNMLLIKRPRQISIHVSIIMNRTAKSSSKSIFSSRWL